MENTLRIKEVTDFWRLNFPSRSFLGGGEGLSPFNVPHCSEPLYCILKLFRRLQRQFVIKLLPASKTLPPSEAYPPGETHKILTKL